MQRDLEQHLYLDRQQAGEAGYPFDWEAGRRLSYDETVAAASACLDRDSDPPANPVPVQGA